MEFDDIQAIAPGVHGPQFWRVLVGQPCKILRFGGRNPTAVLTDAVEDACSGRFSVIARNAPSFSNALCPA